MLSTLLDIDITAGRSLAWMRLNVGLGLNGAVWLANKNCALYPEERIAILKQSRSNPQLLINSNNEMYGVCRHIPRFHRHVKQTTPSTDEFLSKKSLRSGWQKHDWTSTFYNLCRLHQPWVSVNWFSNCSLELLNHQSNSDQEHLTERTHKGESLHQNADLS